MTAIVPTPRLSMSVRVAKDRDAAFIDQLQKMHSHMVGWMPAKQLQGKIEAGQVIVAEDEQKTALGYCVSQDQYSGRDDVGIIYQLNVLPLRQRNLVGATLVKSVFERAAYGCRLFCLWCAQDIQANWFWESVGFLPIAFRTGSASKQRTHIFWQRRIRENDTTTPWWFPSQTKGGALNAERLVLPIPQGVHWRDPMPMLLPQIAVEAPKPLTLPGGAPVKGRPEQPTLSKAQKAAIHRSQSRHLQGVPLGKKAILTGSGIKYVERTDYVPDTDAPEEMAEPAKPKSPPKPRQKNDPKLVAAARELRDRWLEHVNSGQALLEDAGKYDVSRALPAMSAVELPDASSSLKALPNAA